MRKGKEKREKQEEGQEKKQEEEEEKTREKKKQKTTQPTKKVSEAKLAELKMEEVIREKLKWICDCDSRAQVHGVVAAKDKGFSVFSLKMACRKYKPQPATQKRVSVLEAVLGYLEDQEERVQYEL